MPRQPVLLLENPGGVSSGKVGRRLVAGTKVFRAWLGFENHSDLASETRACFLINFCLYENLRFWFFETEESLF